MSTFLKMIVLNSLLELQTVATPQAFLILLLTTFAFFFSNSYNFLPCSISFALFLCLLFAVDFFQNVSSMRAEIFVCFSTDDINAHGAVSGAG